MRPEVTVVMPCRDGEAFVHDTIMHVLALADDAGVAVEIVVVDDGSTDNSREIVQSLPVVLVTQGPRGLAVARNTGVASASAPVITMLDVDDRWTPVLFNVLLPALRSADAPPIVQGRTRDLWPNAGLGPPYEGIHIGSALFRAEVFTEIGPFDETLARLEDFEWFIRAYDLRIPKCRIDLAVLHYFRRPDGLTGSAPHPDPLMARVHRDVLRRRRATPPLTPPAGFPSAADYLGVVPPEAERRPAPRSPGTLLRLDAREVDPTATVRAFATVRNERLRLPAMLDHHRRLGVGAFFVADNASSDGSVDYLLEQPDVHLWSAEGSFAAARCGHDWLNHMIDEHGGDAWRLIIDADELFVYTGYEHMSIDVLCQQLDDEGADAMLALMVDVYSDRSIANTAYEEGADPLAVCPWFDRQPWTSTRETFWMAASHRSYFGGARLRVFGAPSGVDASTYYALQKVPLFRASPTHAASDNFHWLDGARMSRGRAALLHWKYIASFSGYVQDAIDEGEHWGGASQYRHYGSGIDTNPELSLYDREQSVRLIDSTQLARLGIIATVNGSNESGA